MVRFDPIPYWQLKAQLLEALATTEQARAHEAEAGRLRAISVQLRARAEQLRREAFEAVGLEQGLDYEFIDSELCARPMPTPAQVTEAPRAP